MRTRRSLLTAATFVAAVLTLTGGTALAQQAVCLPGLIEVLNNGPHAGTYLLLRQTLLPRVPNLATLLRNTVNQTTYDNLLLVANATANSINNGRLVIALPDGTVAVDTGRNDGACANCNSYANFQAKAINENHNSRVSFMTAQMWQCGMGAESKFSTTTGKTQTGLAFRLPRTLASHLDSEGTARLSQEQ